MVQVTVLSWIQWIGIFLFTGFFVIHITHQYIPLLAHTLPLELLGILILVVTYRYLCPFTVRIVEIEVENGQIYFARKNQKYFTAPLKDIQYIRLNYTDTGFLMRAVIGFSDRKISFFRPFTLEDREDQLDDVCHYLTGLDFLQRKSVKGWIFGIGKKRNNRLVKEYRNVRYM